MLSCAEIFTRFFFLMPLVTMIKLSNLFMILQCLSKNSSFIDTYIPAKFVCPVLTVDHQTVILSYFSLLKANRKRWLPIRQNS